MKFHWFCFIKNTLFSLNFWNETTSFETRSPKWTRKITKLRLPQSVRLPIFQFYYFKMVIGVDQSNIDQYANESTKIKFRCFFKIEFIFIRTHSREQSRQLYDFLNKDCYSTISNESKKSQDCYNLIRFFNSVISESFILFTCKKIHHIKIIIIDSEIL